MCDCEKKPAQQPKKQQSASETQRKEDRMALRFSRYHDRIETCADGQGFK